MVRADVAGRVAQLTAPRRWRRAPRASRAAGWLRDARTLAFRLHRADLIGWSIALLVAGTAYGAFTRPLVDGFADAPEDFVAVMGGADDMLDGYLGLMGLTMALMVTVFAILAVQSVRGEESGGRTEPVPATAVSHTGRLGGHLAVTARGVPWLLLVAGLATGAAAALCLRSRPRFSNPAPSSV
ncbi:hypothetical protein [Actinomadura rugatobispora]|uniref:ABC transporter permease n=1 Tax=Actinomadura rugatobispora TaxID=1994 RepID=A0ABW1A591_9ACTN|nr:hypothetical protein GCM10010200_082810 [Actinomadura rugatobispora]